MLSLSGRLRVARLDAGLALAGMLFMSGCAQHYTVTRLYDGKAEEGRFIEPSAYAAYLRGAIAEAHGDYAAALTEYQTAAKVDAADPEIWTRIGAVRCKANPHDMQARVAVREALILDEDYAPAWEERATCEIARDVDRVDVEMSAARGAELDPKSTRAQTLLAGVEEKRNVEAARERLVALTLVAGGDADAWSALAVWAGAHGDAELESTAFSRVIALSPTKAKMVSDACEALAGDGALREARTLAGALADAQRRLDRDDARAQFSIAHSSLAARLAVDDAIVQKNGSLVRARASTGRVPLEEVAARAALLGEMEIARDLASELVAADPKNAAASLALSAVDPLHSVEGISFSADAIVPAAIYVALAASHVSETIQTPFEPIFSGDSLVSDSAAKLVAEGKADRRLLSGEAEIDADVRSGKAPQLSKGVDARHRFLACAFQPTGDCDSMTRHFQNLGSRDLLVTVSLAHLALRRQALASELRGLEEKLRVVAPIDPFAISTEDELHKRAAAAPVARAPVYDFSDDHLNGAAVKPN